MVVALMLTAFMWVIIVLVVGVCCVVKVVVVSVMMVVLVLYSYEGPGKHVTLSLRACETNLFCVQLYWLIELCMGPISLDCKKSERV